MNFLQKYGVFFLALLVVSLVIPQLAHAGDDCWFSVSCWTNWIIGWISYFIALVAGLCIAVEAWMIGIMLAISDHITDSPAVTAGFPVTLALANLGFVIAIIVMAIGTILRYESHAVKKMLPKLIAAAILVNFSLVIAGTILTFSNQTTRYFLDKMGGPTKFADQLAGAFQPQKAFTFINENTSKEISQSDLDKIQGAFGPPGNNGVSDTIGQAIAPLASLVFVVATLIVSVITLFALIIMLLIRYIFLGILLILMPFAWLLWLFPEFESHWKKWWTNFIRWTFFSPIVVFFLWLAITAASNVNNQSGIFNFKNYQTTDGAWGTIATVLTNIFSPLIVNMMQVSIVVGLMLGGLFAANSMGITFAGTAMGAATSIGKGVGSWAGRRSRQFATAPLRSQRMQKAAEKIQTFGTGTGLGSKIFRATGVGALAGYGVRWVGRSAQNLDVGQGEKLVHDAEKRTGNLSSDLLASRIHTMTAPERIVALKKLRERGDLDKVENLNRYLDEDMFKRFGETSAYKDLNKALLGNDNARKAAQSENATVAELRAKLRPTVSAMKKGDPSKGKNWEEIMNEGEFAGLEGEKKLKYQVAQIAEIAETNLGLLPSILSQLSGKTLERFQNVVLPQIRPLISANRIGAMEKMIENNLFNINPIDTGPTQTKAGAGEGAAGGGAGGGAAGGGGAGGGGATS